MTPEHRRCGLGAQLLAAIVAHAQQQPGLEELILTVTVENLAAVHSLLRARSGDAAYWLVTIARNRLVDHWRPDLPVRAALYFPLMSAWCEL